ncbi:2-keto-4-pentenoate hydratase [Rhizobium sp. CRIBSB]|nr:2-keto-4-pentenoate hydratase [Rhizobium sp. CRIBSB]
MTAALASVGTESSAIARTFVDARLSARAVPVWPGEMPPSLDAAYVIQDQAISLWPDRVAGWKLGRIPPPLDARFGAGRLAGPIFSANVWLAGPEPTAFGVIPGGFAAVEAEYILELGQDVPSRDDWTAAQVADLVARVHIGVEIAGSPFREINDHGPAVTAADFGNNAGLILGATIENWRPRLQDLTCRTLIDGTVIGTGGAASIPNGPLDSLAFLLKVLHRRGRSMTAGELISTGAATGVHPIAIGQEALADFGTDGSIACVAVTAQAGRD